MVEACRRHPDREGLFGVATHYLNATSWRDTINVDQTYGPFCDECRLEFNRWATTEAPKPITPDERAIIDAVHEFHPEKT